MTHWHYKYTGRGYLRFPALNVLTPCADGSLSVCITRGGPSRVEVSIEGEGESPNPEVIDEVVRRVHGHMVVFCQAPIQDFHLSSIVTVDDTGKPHHHGYLHMLDISTRDAAVRVPFEHMTDMGKPDLDKLTNILATAKAIRPSLVASIEHSLTRAEGNVEAFLANYAILESVFGQGQKGVDEFIRRVEPDVKVVKGSRDKEVTIYTKLRNAKGHPSDMSQADASARIGHLIPKLHEHVRTALIESSTAG